MSNENKPMTPVDQIDPATWQKIGRWLADQIHDREIDAEEIAAHNGPAFLPALRGLAGHLLTGGQLPLLDARLHLLSTVADKLDAMNLETGKVGAIPVLDGWETAAMMRALIRGEDYASDDEEIEARKRRMHHGTPVSVFTTIRMEFSR